MQPIEKLDCQIGMGKGLLSTFFCHRHNIALAMQVPESEQGEMHDLAIKKDQHLQEQFKLKESLMAISMQSSTEPHSRALTQQCAQRLIALLLVLPHGVAKMSHAIPGIYWPAWNTYCKRV